MTANAASAAIDRRWRHGTISSVASTIGQSLNAAPIASAQPSTIGRSRRHAATARIAAAVDQASTRLKNSPSTGISAAAPHTAAAMPQPQNSDADDDRVGDQIEDHDAEAERRRVRRAAAPSALKTSSVPIGCST